MPEELDFSREKELGSLHIDNCYRVFHAPSVIKWPGSRVTLTLDADDIFKHTIIFSPGIRRISSPLNRLPTVTTVLTWMIGVSRIPERYTLSPVKPLRKHKYKDGTFRSVIARTGQLEMQPHKRAFSRLLHEGGPAVQVFLDNQV